MSSLVLCVLMLNIYFYENKIIFKNYFLILKMDYINKCAVTHSRHSLGWTFRLNSGPCTECRGGSFFFVISIEFDD